MVSKTWINNLLKKETANCSAGLTGYESPTAGQIFVQKYLKSKTRGNKGELQKDKDKL